MTTNQELCDALVQSSGKFVFVDKLLPRLIASGRKTLIFSQFKLVLDILSQYLAARGYAYERIVRFPSLCLMPIIIIITIIIITIIIITIIIITIIIITILLLLIPSPIPIPISIIITITIHIQDGNVRGPDRQASIARFNEPGSQCRVFLLSTRAGGLGLNLQIASTVIIFDSDWVQNYDDQ